MSFLRAGLLSLAAGLSFASMASAHDFRSPGSGATPSFDEFEKAIASEPLGSSSRQKMLLYVGALQTWPGTTKLRVCFWDTEPGYEARKEQIARIAEDLTVDIQVKFIWKVGGKFVNCASEPMTNFHVRVALSGKDSLLASSDKASSFFAVIGRAGKNSTLRKATVNLPFDSAATEAYAKPRILHEFCHVLGCLHEHQRITCDFNEQEIMLQLGLTQAQFDREYARPDSSMNPQAFGKFDETSVMLYRTEKWMFKSDPPNSPCYRPSDPKGLSDLDRKGIAAAYSPEMQRLSRMPLDVFLSQGEMLLSDAARLRLQAGALRSQAGAYSMDKSDNPLAGGVMNFQLSLRVLALEFSAARMESEAEAYNFTPETVAHLRAAFAMSQ